MPTGVSLGLTAEEPPEQPATASAAITAQNTNAKRARARALGESNTSAAISRGEKSPAAAPPSSPPESQKMRWAFRHAGNSAERREASVPLPLRLGRPS